VYFSDGAPDDGEEPRPLWNSLLEACWLLAALLPSLAVNLWARQPFEPFKAALLRTLVWSMAGIALLRGIALRRNLWRELSQPLLWPALALLAVQTLATLTAVDRGLSFWGSTERAQGWLTLSSTTLLFLLTAAYLQSRDQLDRLALALVAAAPPLVLLGLAQALGWSPLPLFTDARSPVYATLGRSNFLGAILALLAPLTLALLVNAPRRRRIWGALLLAGELAVLALTQARGAWLALAVAAGLWALGMLGPRIGPRWRRWLALAGGLAGVGTAAALVAVLATGAANAQGSTAARLTIWRATLHLIAERPLLGHGPEALGLLFPRVYPPELVYYEGRGVLVDRAHNFLLDTAVTTGLAGVLALGVLLALFFALGWRAAARATEPRTRALLAACLAAVGGNLAGTLVSFDVTATATTTALLMALAVALARLEVPTARPAGAPVASPRPMRRGALATLAVVAGVGVAVLLANIRPTLADAAALTADRFAAAGEWEGAIAAAERAVALAPQEPAYRRTLSWAHLQAVVQGDGTAAVNLPRAEAALLAARDLRPLDVQTWAALGELYGQWANGWDPARLAQANAAYAQAVTLAPNSAMLRTAWGMLELQGGRFSNAAAHFRRAVALDATDGRAWAHLGEAELAQGRVEEALAAFQEALHWEPELSAAHAGLAQCLLLQAPP
jgi:O-antigen ligase